MTNHDMKNLCLFIDESGSGNPKAAISKCYIVCGCLINSHQRDEMRIQADQIKFKYWGKTSIVFHSTEIGREEGDFKILKDEKIKKEFYKDILKFLVNANVNLLVVLVDLEKALKRNWNSQKVYQETSNVLIYNYILSLLAHGEVKGKLIIEAATAEKDFIYHKAVSFYLSNGIKELKVSFQDVQNVLTEISFVTKKNHDIEEQIADLLAYGAKLKFLKKKSIEMDEYQAGILKILNSKLFRMHPETGVKKKKFYEKIDSFKIIP